MEDEDNRFQLNCRFWENCMDEGDGDPFESALSSMVTAQTAIENEKVVLIGRLGTICNGDPLTSSYSTPLNSPPNLNLSSFLMENNHHHHRRQMRGGEGGTLLPPFSSDPGFAERAARLSSFASNNRSLTLESPPQMAISGSKSTTMVAVQESRYTKSIISRLCGSENVELGDSRENSTVSDQIPSANSRKRKSNAKGKGTDANGVTSEKGESGAKRCKSEQVEDDVNLKQSSSSSSSKPPKDYIHVRARRGEATDAHSLAERVRREKISERMKLLQDLVPGCNKVTGKAVMLDEIINYVQSLQRQVEFLSMKLAHVVNPRMDSKDVVMQLSWEKKKNRIYHWDHSFYHMDGRSNLHTQPPLCNQTPLHLPPCPIEDNFTQASTFWEDDLHSFVQMGFGQNRNQGSGIQMNE